MIGIVRLSFIVAEKERLCQERGEKTAGIFGEDYGEFEVFGIGGKRFEGGAPHGTDAGAYLRGQ